ncbi:MAG: ethanolamine ammonia-lyase subunit EutB [Acidobacteria bacterium]|nr:ethanolamine ammonia-lyase subunit EutB [Acidobacteriota bacterium]
MRFSSTLRGQTYAFPDLKTLLAKASPLRSADQLAEIAASTQSERVAAQWVLADVPLVEILNAPLVDPDQDEVSQLILDQHDPKAFSAIQNCTVGSFREWLLAAEPQHIQALKWGLTPEMVAAVCKIMRNQELISVAKKCKVVTQFRNTLGLPQRLATRIQPNHPTDDARAVLAGVLDGLLLGAGDAVIGINPATDQPAQIALLIELLEQVRNQFEIPIQHCVLAHVTTSLDLIRNNVPIDLVFQSIAGTQAANASFGINLALLKEVQAAALELQRGPGQVMYFETGQGSALSANAHHGIDAQTCEARAYAVARAFDPLLVNTVVGFIGPEYLFDGKQIIRAGLEDHFCGKLLGLPMGVDVCYTNHAEADSDDMDTLLTLLGVAGVNYIMGVPGADDIMLQYQSTSFHDALYLREVLGLRPAPEFEAWLTKMGIWNIEKGFLNPQAEPGLKAHVLSQLMRGI